MKRNKVIVHATTEVPLYGTISIDMLVDFNQGTVLTYVPFLFYSYCQRDNFTQPFNLTKVLGAAYDKSLNVTKYLGEEGLPWNSS